MKKGNIATVLKKGSEWSKVRSGNVTGYVKNQYLVFGDEIENFAKQNVKKVAKVQTETLRVRKKASTDSKIVTLVSAFIFPVVNTLAAIVSIAIDSLIFLVIIMSLL